MVHVGDVAELFKTKQTTWDAVLLDVDNGPEGFTHADNNKLYSMAGLHAIRQTLRPKGMLAIWSAWRDPKFIQQLKKHIIMLMLKRSERIKAKVVDILFIWLKNRVVG